MKNLTDQQLLELLLTVANEARARIYDEYGSGHWNDCYLINDLRSHIEYEGQRAAAEAREQEIDLAWQQHKQCS